MDTVEKRAVICLHGCTFLPGSWDKRFVRSLYSQLESEPNKSLTLKQQKHLRQLHHRYRNQLSSVCSEIYTIGDWCNANGYTDLFLEGFKWWAFAPGAVMAVPVSTKCLPDSDEAFRIRTILQNSIADIHEEKTFR